MKSEIVVNFELIKYSQPYKSFMIEFYSLLTRNISERRLLFPISTFSASSRVAIYAAFLDLVDHLQLLHIASSAWYTSNRSFHESSLANELMIKANNIQPLTNDHLAILYTTFSSLLATRFQTKLTGSHWPHLHIISVHLHYMYVTHAPGLNVPELWLGLSTVKVTWEPETRLPQSVIKKIEDGHTIQTAPKTSSCYGLNSTTLVVTTSDSSPSKKPRTETSPTTLKGNTGFVPHPPLHTITICTSSLLSVYSLGSSITCHPVSAAYLLKITRSQI